MKTLFGNKASSLANYNLKADAIRNALFSMIRASREEPNCVQKLTIDGVSHKLEITEHKIIHPLHTNSRGILFKLNDPKGSPLSCIWAIDTPLSEKIIFSAVGTENQIKLAALLRGMFEYNAHELNLMKKGDEIKKILETPIKNPGLFKEELKEKFNTHPVEFNLMVRTSCQGSYDDRFIEVTKDFNRFCLISDLISSKNIAPYQGKIKSENIERIRADESKTPDSKSTPLEAKKAEETHSQSK